MPKLSRTTFVIIALILAGGGYYAYQRFGVPPVPVKYVLGTATKDTLVVSVTGTGQVSVTNKVDLKPKVTGTYTSVLAIQGKKVRAGDVIARIDATDAVKAVNDAQTALDTAQLSLDKLQQPADALTKLQTDNALVDAKAAKDDAVASLAKSYDDGFNSVSDTFLDFPTVITGLHDVLLGTDFNSSNWNIDGYSDAIRQYYPGVQTYHDDADVKYRAAKDDYDRVFQEYKGLSRTSDRALIEQLVKDASTASTSAAEALKSADNLIRYYSDKTTERGLVPKPVAATHLAKLGGYTGTMNGHISTLASVVQSISTAKDNITKADRTIAERQQSLAKLDAGADPLDVRTQQITIDNRKSALFDARAKLADYVIRAPFDGIIAVVGVKVGDDASSGTAAATVITDQETAVISLNEVDAASVKIGQKATLTFDAVPDITLSGAVASIDTLGAVSQGVVSYSVTIGLDTGDARVKPGMSVSASVITDVRTDVLLVPSGAVKIQGSTTSAQVPASSDGLAASVGVSTGVPLPAVPVSRDVKVGATDGVSTEVLSGLAEGDIVITRTIQPSAVKAATTTQSIIPGGSALRGAAGGGFRGN